MKNVLQKIGLSMIALLPFQSNAQIVDGTGDAGELSDLIVSIVIFINETLIPFIIGIGFLVFVWGIFLYFILGGANDEKKEQGKSLIIYGTLGFVLIIIFFGVVNLLTQSTGLEGETVKGIPEVPIPNN